MIPPIACALRTIAACLSLAICVGADAAEYIFELNNPPAAGQLIVEVYDEADNFGELRDPVKRAVLPLNAPGEPYRIQDLAPGAYAVLVIHDENGNGFLDRNFVGLPREPVGLSNDYQPKGPPNFERARVQLNGGEPVSQQLTLTRPLGKIGQFGVGFVTITQSSPYRASDTGQVMPLPAVVYIGERLQIMGPAFNYTLAGSDRVRLAVRGALRIGAYDEDDSPYLQGMGDRKATFMAGLALNTELPAGVNLSLGYGHDLLDRVGGGAAQVSLSRSFQFGSWRLSPSVSANWLDEDLANYDFGVPEEQATAQRPAYQLDDAVNWGIGVSALYEISPRWHAALRVEREQLDSAISDSPIVDQRYLISGFGALTYTF